MLKKVCYPWALLISQSCQIQYSDAYFLNEKYRELPLRKDVLFALHSECFFVDVK